MRDTMSTRPPTSPSAFAASPFSLSLHTVIAASPLLGHALEDRGTIRAAQDPRLLERVRRECSTRLRTPSQQHLFCVAPLDLLVERHDGRRRFHLLELNGTGIGGLTNLSAEAVQCVLDGIGQLAAAVPAGGGAPLMLVASSGLESTEQPRLNRLIHEKLMYADALRAGFARRGLDAPVLAMPTLAAQPDLLTADGPAIVVGYMKQFLAHLEADDTGGLRLLGRLVTGIVNDRFVTNVLDHCHRPVDLARLQIMNRCFAAGADKGVAYSLFNDIARDAAPAGFPERIEFERCGNRSDLVRTVFQWLDQGRRPVIKPHGTGLGHGIEFFLSRDETDDAVIRQIDRSLRLTAEFYGTRGGAFPYTVCDYVDADRIDSPGHRLHGHKYELRVVVYRDGLELRAHPAIVKVACAPWSDDDLDPAALINNITASCVRTRAKGTDFMFPLANAESLALFGLEERDLLAVCRTATRFVRHVLDEVEDQPARFGLPGRQAAVPALVCGPATAAPVAVS
jgi:hypothetical protein